MGRQGGGAYGEEHEDCLRARWKLIKSDPVQMDLRGDM